MPKEKKKKEDAPKLDTIAPGKRVDKKADVAVAVSKKDSTAGFKMTDNKIPHRGVLWYVVFSLIFLVSSALIIYLSDWALLFFVVVFSGVTLWRGNMGTDINVGIYQEGIKINDKEFFFDQIESWHFSSIGDDYTVSFQMVKKYLPRLTFIFTDENYIDKIREGLGGRVPETEPREESIVDFLIRKLKV